MVGCAYKSGAVATQLHILAQLELSIHAASDTVQGLPSITSLHNGLGQQQSCVAGSVMRVLAKVPKLLQKQHHSWCCTRTAALLPPQQQRVVTAASTSAVGSRDRLRRRRPQEVGALFGHLLPCLTTVRAWLCDGNSGWHFSWLGAGSSTAAELRDVLSSSWCRSCSSRAHRAPQMTPVAPASAYRDLSNHSR